MCTNYTHRSKPDLTTQSYTVLQLIIKMARWSNARCFQLLFCLVVFCTSLSFMAYRSASAPKNIRGYQLPEQLLPLPSQLLPLPSQLLPSQLLPSQQREKPELDPQTEAEKEEEKLGFVRSGFNQFRSDRMPLDREIPDTRDLRCLERPYPSGMPSTSVVIIFHNEAYSVLLRTITSVFNRSPPELIHEIILVDDASDHEDLKKKLEDYVSSRPKLRLIRHKERKGLIRARMTGADASTGRTITFLDSHCEANVGWLEPLLERIHLNRTTVVCPVIDVISWEKIEYSDTQGAVSERGGFSWGLEFKWKKIPDYEQKRRQYDEIREVKSPTMAGGLFSIDRSYFYEIGAYDPGMEIWGGENLEMSFRIWMCGGQLEIIPCSRVGHIFREQQPYTFPGGVDKILVNNYLRLTEAWMDEYKEHYYSKRPDVRNREYGDIRDRLAIRERLHCKSFKWYLENVYPELPLPNENLYHGGWVHNPKSNLCLDTYGKREDGEVGLYLCHGQGGNQDFAFTNAGEISFDDDLCLDVDSAAVPGDPVKIMGCNELGDSQKWEYSKQTKTLKHPLSGLCLAKGEDGDKAVMQTCRRSPSQVWVWARHFTPVPSRVKQQQAH